MEELRVIFVLPETCSGEEEVSEVMSEAFGICKQTVKNVEWVTEAEFPVYNLSKTDFVVFETFEGKNFDSLKETKCASILGPWCLLVCLVEGRPIPNYPWPIYNVAMADCVVSCSHLPKSTKAVIKEKVQLMGGCYFDDLTCKNTHLITESVKSEKYLQAAENNLKIMTTKWVEMVWEASQKKNIHCTDEEFSKYKCLPFHKLTISSTGFPSTGMRQELAEKIVGNGGVFTGVLALTKTDVLVVYGVNGVLSEKYKAARKNPDIFCVNVNWVTDSIEKGYALQHHLYRVHKGTSTPTKDSAMCPDFSMISAIGSHSGRITQVEETVIRAIPSRVHISPPNKRRAFSSDFGALIDGLDIKKAKKAGQYLDGCSVFVAGFTPMQREKLCKILNLSGATRHDDISDRLTHVIIGNPLCPEVKILKTKNYPISLVSIHWLLDSIEKERAVEEDNYLINLHDDNEHMFSSPLSKKGLNLLISNKTLTSQEFDSEDQSASNGLEPDRENTLMQQYLRPTTEGDDDSDTLQKLINGDSNFEQLLKSRENLSQSTMEGASSQEAGIFEGKKFNIIGFNQEETNMLKEQIECDSGKVVSKSFKGITDYVVAPMIVSSPIQTAGQTTVNNLWIIECTEEGEVRPILYYHEPLFVSNTKPLENCVVTTSGYSLFEKKFLKALIMGLGGICQEQFARVASEPKQLLASTHLVSLEATGKKYEGALKWGLPVVKKEWLFACAQQGERISEEEHIVGDARANHTIANSNGKSRGSSNKNTSVSTPQNRREPINMSITDKTPINQRLFAGGSITDTPDPCSQVTPINKLMEEVRKTNLLGTPQTPPKLKPLVGFDTPPSPFGVFLEPHMSAKSKKELMRYLDRLPDFQPRVPRRLSTPLSEVKRRCLKKLLGEEDSRAASFIMDPKDASISGHHQDESDEIENCDNINKISDQQIRNDSTCTEGSDENGFINTRLKQIQEMANAFSNNRRGSRNFEFAVASEGGQPSDKDSQPFTVGWDYNDPGSKQAYRRIFVLSGVDNDIRQSIVQKIEKLGGQVSELASYDPKCTHLLSVRPARNEKTLACMAAGKWILHVSYVEKSVLAGKFLDEEDFEFGNIKSKDRLLSLMVDKETQIRFESMHWWRKEVSRRGYGAFNDMRAIVVAQKRDPIIRVIEAGGGQVINATPPFDDSVHATHCLLEMKSVSDFSVYNSLAQRGVLCINTLYISEFLYRTNKDVQDAILPQYVSFYK